MKILIIRMSPVSRVFLASSLAQDIKTALPDAEITWLAEESGVELIRNNPYIDHIISWNRNKQAGLLKKLKDAVSLAVALSNEKYDYILDHQGAAKTFFLLRNLRKSRIIGFRKHSFCLLRYYYCRRVFTFDSMSCYDRNRALAAELLKDMGIKYHFSQPVTYPVYTVSESAAAFAANELAEKRRYIAFAVDGDGVWPADRWCELAEKIYRKLGAKIVLMGMNTVLAKAITEADAEFCNLTGRLNYSQAFAVLSQCDASVCLESEYMHLSAAAGKPAVCLCDTEEVKKHYIFKTNIKVIYRPVSQKFLEHIRENNTLNITSETVFSQLVKCLDTSQSIF